MNLKSKILKEILTNLPRPAKQLIAMLCDLCLCLISVACAYYLRFEEIIFLKGPPLNAALFSAFFALPVFWFMGLYGAFFRNSHLSIMLSVLMAIMVYSLIYFSIITLYGIPGVPRSIGIIQPMVLFFVITTSRLFGKFILEIEKKKNSKSLKITMIYGAGNSGRHLASILENSNEFKVVGFLDDDKSLHGQNLERLTIYGIENLNKLIASKGVELVLLALPSINRFKRNQILNKLHQYKLKVHTLPTVEDIVGGNVTVSDIKELDLNDILNRQPVAPKKELLFKNIKSQAVLVTGAGGSIGAELCRQIVKGEPKALILCEHNEFALYNIYDELKQLNLKTKITPLLINIQNENKIVEIFKIFKVNTVYHAAAYKHVPLVETNICEGVLNNVFGTYAVVKACIQQNVSNFVLISSDKAVRPTNIMGASKRLAELCVQGLYHGCNNHKINMSMVRFGNVLESSGSVIPKFKKQIKQGGPITLTHPEVTRYFMTITEAAQLVIQAGALNDNCNVFVLDMGKSVKIKDLIYRMVQLSGLNVKDKENHDGDIEIKIVGLRAGEKLYEELLLGNDPQPTSHEKIQKAQDPFVQIDELEKYLNVLKSHIANNKPADVKLLLENILSNYQSEYEIVDYFYSKKHD